MKFTNLTCSGCIRRSPFSSYVEAAGASSYCSYNHMLLATVFRYLEQYYCNLRGHVQLWDVSCQKQIDMLGDGRIGKISGLPLNEPAHLN